MSDEEKGMRGLKEKAERENLRIVYPTPNQLFIDIDSKEDYEFFKNQVNRFDEKYYISNLEDHPSKSGDPNKRHITITTERTWTELERLLMQACLGSDRKREFWGFCNIQAGEVSTIFFEKENQNEVNDESQAEF